MDQDNRPTILFIPEKWVEYAFDLAARTGHPVELVFYPTKIDRRAFERRQFDAAVEHGIQRRAERRASLLSLLEPARG